MVQTLKFNMTNCLPKEFEKAKERLSDHPEILKLLELKGISRKTISQIPVWLTDDMDVFFPIYAWDINSAFEPVGVIFYSENLSNGVVYFKTTSRGGFLWVKMPDRERDVILARDPFEWALLWQEGYEDVWCIPDSSRIPLVARTWNQLIFMSHTDNDMQAYKGFFLASYNMEESYNKEDLSDMMTNTITQRDSQWYQFTNPLLVGNRLSFAVSRNGRRCVFDSSGQFYRIRFDRFRTISNFVHPAEGLVEITLYDIKWSWVLQKVSLNDMYKKLYTYLKSKLFFCTSAQLMTFTSFVMYQWVAPHCTIKHNLQVYSFQNQWLTQIYNVLINLVPRNFPNPWDKNISSILWINDAKPAQMWLAPHIFLTLINDDLPVARMNWWGIPMVIDHSQWNDHDIWPYKPNSNDSGMREMLFNFAVHYDYSMKEYVAKYNMLLPFNMILWQLYTSYYKQQKILYEQFERSRVWLFTIHRVSTSNNFFNTWRKVRPLRKVRPWLKKLKTILSPSDISANE